MPSNHSTYHYLRHTLIRSQKNVFILQNSRSKIETIIDQLNAKGESPKNIITIPAGSNCYLVSQGEQHMMIDAGAPGMGAIGKELHEKESA